MIKFKVKKSTEYNRLFKDLKQFPDYVQDRVDQSFMDLSESLEWEYEQSIQDNVYDLYDPKQYNRTYHLKGGHGAMNQDMQISGSTYSYDFYIDGNSTDPVDGTTWDEKAEKIESGNMTGASFRRPFIDETQERLDDVLTRTANTLELEIDAYLNKMGG